MNGKNIRFQHLKIKDKKDSKSEIKGEIVGAVQQNDDFSIKATESAPMKFCPECNGMMLPTEDGVLRCNSCGYAFDGTKRKIDKPYYYYNHEPEIRYESHYTEDQKRIISRLNEFDEETFDHFCSYLHISNTQEREEVIKQVFSNRSEQYINSAIERALERKREIAKEKQLKNKLYDLDDEIFDILVLDPYISSSKTKDEQIDDLISKYHIYQIENKIDMAKRTIEKNKRRSKRNHVEKLRADFKEELLGLDPRVLERLFIFYDITSPSLDIERKMDILVRNNSFKSLRQDYKKIKRDLGL